MLKQLLVTFSIAILCTLTAPAQINLVLVNSPDDIAGSYDFTDSFTATATPWGADLSTGTWTADAVLVDDSVDVETDGCEAIADITGKIALVDRGACFFSVKAWNAQMGGAIACVIINNQPGGGLVNMAPGDFADSVSIPVVFITYESGEIIKGALANGPVNMTIGSVSVGNNIEISTETTLKPYLGAMPMSQINADPPMFPLGGLVVNNGENTAINPTINVQVAYTPAGGGSATTVYDETGTGSDTDTTTFIQLPEFSPVEGMGLYDITYTVSSDSTDELPSNNTVATTFMSTNNIYSKGTYDPVEGLPNSPNIIRTNDGGSLEFMAGFKFPAAAGMVIDSLTFLVWHDDGTLADVGASNVNAYLYEWNDTNEDGVTSNDEFTIVGFAQSVFDDPTAQFNFVRTQMLDFDQLTAGYTIPDNDKIYFVGLRYRGDLNVRFGFDCSFDQEQLVNEFVFNDEAELPYIGVTDWMDDERPNVNDGFIFSNFRCPVAIALSFSPPSNTGETNPEVGSFTLYPNPVSDRLGVEARLAKNYDNIEYNVVNANGQIVRTTERNLSGTTDNTTLDVSELPAGQYFLNLNTEDGSISQPFTIQR